MQQFFIDEQTLRTSLEGVAHPESYYEVIFHAENTLPESCSLDIFAAICTMMSTPSFTVVRLYLGRDEPTAAQLTTVLDAYRHGRILTYRRVGLPQQEARSE